MDRDSLKENQALRLDRKFAIIICISAVGLCLGYAWFRADFPPWLKNSGGGIPYTLFFVTFFFALFPKRSLLETIAWLAIGWSCVAEFLQLWQVGWLVQIRATPLGAALLGSSFTWVDIPPYFIGGGLGYLLLRLLFWRVSRKESNQMNPI
ncbi:DUF2809 domain-containing protein [Mariniblastus sp.]|nr:DUF2809 domain-containing protein [bacterium]MDA7902898.1 DUF2809 domain-containing protein [Mariniblastus sp.]MDB4564356.1 DUF2809 domain-containing protein [Mariniblastus sp.]MDC3223847.1 DUF2809 domain-containing protein [Mariniblastus sp.]